MTKTRRSSLVLLGAAAAILVLLFCRMGTRETGRDGTAVAPAPAANREAERPRAHRPPPARPAPPSAEAPRQAVPDPVLAQVEAFDAHVDSWQEPRENGATLQDAEELHDRLMQLPEHLREEELNRALVLVPDENAFIFAAILFDKSLPPEMLDAVLCDMLNRDEDVKNTLLKKIHEDREHPCWEDVDWLLSVTGGDRGGNKSEGGKERR